MMKALIYMFVRMVMLHSVMKLLVIVLLTLLMRKYWVCFVTLLHTIQHLMHKQEGELMIFTIIPLVPMEVGYSR